MKNLAFSLVLTLTYIVFAATCLSGCGGKHHLQSQKYKVVEAAENTEDVEIPSELWDKIEGIVPGERVRPVQMIRKFSGVKVWLAEKNPGVLGGQNYEIRFGRGGGIIDFSNYVTNSNGSFYVGFEQEFQDEKHESKIYFVSNSRKRSIDGKVYGAGCKSFLDVSHFFYQASKNEGFLVNTTRNRHVAVLNGTFVFVLERDGLQYLSQITFIDSKHLELQCATKSGL